MATRQGELRRFAALRRHLNALQQESYTVARVLENTDWRSGNQTSRVAEFQSLTNRSDALDDEMADIEYLLDYYDRTMLASNALVLMPHTVALITAIVLIVFIAMTVAAGWLAGALNAG
jgi:hypothetical protein